MTGAVGIVQNQNPILILILAAAVRPEGSFHGSDCLTRCPAQCDSSGGRLTMSREQLATIVEMLRSQPLMQPSVGEMRARLGLMGQGFPVPPDVRCARVSAGGVPAEWVAAPGAAEDRAILYLHGGGYAIGSIDSHRAMAGSLSRAAQARVLL